MGASDSWLRLFESQFFDEHLALRYIHQKSGGIHEYLCNKLFQLHTEAIERILLQLCEIAVGTPTSSPALQQTLIKMCSQMPTLALKIQWLLQSRLDASSKDSEPVIRNLLKACHSAAIRRCGNMEMLNQIPTEDQRSSVKFCPDSSEHHPLVATDASSSNITPVQHTNTDRLANLHNELGMGEGVTALVRASLLNLGRGGTGVVLPSSDAEDRRGQTFDSSIGKSQHCFYPTLKFFEMLCNCAQGIMQLPQKSRHSELRQRLEACNRYLFSRAAIAKVLWPLTCVEERVIRIVPDRMVILQSRDHAPFLLYVETLCPSGQPKQAGRPGELMKTSKDETCNSPQLQSSIADLDSQSEYDGDRLHEGDGNDVMEAETTSQCATEPECIGETGAPLSPSWVNIDGLDLNSTDAVADTSVPAQEAVFGVQQVHTYTKDASWHPHMTSEEYIKFVYGDNLDDVRRRIQRISPFGSQQGWNCHAVIVKSGDDCRQELLAMQLIEAFQRVFDVESLPLWLQPYKVLPTSSQTALIELLPDTLSVHSIKRSLPSGSSLADHFFRMFPKGTQTCEAAQRSFAQSLAGYSLVCYLLQVKDRHNANIMLDQKGHIIHIDFDFMLSNSPGGVRFEQAPFKLTSEYMQVMGSDVHGSPAPTFQYFKNLWCAGHAAAAKHADEILQLVEIMQHSGLPCFTQGRKAVDALKRRFQHRKDDVAALLEVSIDAWTTRQYDYYQRVLNGIL